MKRKFLLQGAFALAVVWTLVWVVMRRADAVTPSPHRLAAYLSSDPLASKDRSAVIARVAREYNRLEFLDRRLLRSSKGSGAFERFIAGLSPAEREAFVEMILPAGFRELLDGFTRLSERDRMRMLERSKRELAENLPDSPARQMIEAADPKWLAHIARTGIGSFYAGLTPEAKLQLLPFIEQVQNNVRRLDD